MGMFPNRRFFLLLGIAICLAVLMWARGSILQAAILRNLAWVGLTQHVFEMDIFAQQRLEQSTPEAIETPFGRLELHALDYENYFRTVVNLTPHDRRASLGLGVSRILAGERAQARQAWQAGAITPDLVIPVADWYQRQNQWPAAFALYQTLYEVMEDDVMDLAASTSAPPGSDDKSILAEKIAGACYQSGWHLDRLDDANAAFCEHIIGDASNLIVNGHFDSGNLSMWTRRHLPGFQYRVESINTVDHRTEVDPADVNHVAWIQAADQGEWGGIYQSLELFPGTRVRFSASIKVEVEEQMRVYYLQLRGTGENGSWQRTEGPLRETHDWTEYTVEYVIPSDHRGFVRFYPVFLRGTGNIWFDNVRVTIVKD